MYSFRSFPSLCDNKLEVAIEEGAEADTHHLLASLTGFIIIHTERRHVSQKQ